MTFEKLAAGQGEKMSGWRLGGGADIKHRAFASVSQGSGMTITRLDQADPQDKTTAEWRSHIE